MPTLKTLRNTPAGRKGGPFRSPTASRTGKAKTSTAKALLKHAGSWVGGDLEARLAEVYASRARTSF